MKNKNLEVLTKLKSRLDKLSSELNQPSLDRYKVKLIKAALPDASSELQKIYLDETSKTE